MNQSLLEFIIIHKSIAFVTVALMSFIWFRYIKGKLSLPKKSLWVLLAFSVPLIYFYPTGLVACEVCESVYVIQHIIAGILIFFILAILLKLMLSAVNRFST